MSALGHTCDSLCPLPPPYRRSQRLSLTTPGPPCLGEKQRAPCPPRATATGLRLLLQVPAHLQRSSTNERHGPRRGDAAPPEPAPWGLPVAGAPLPAEPPGRWDGEARAAVTRHHPPAALAAAGSGHGSLCSPAASAAPRKGEREEAEDGRPRLPCRGRAARFDSGATGREEAGGRPG